MASFSITKNLATLLLEDLAEATWSRLRDAGDLNVSQGEETITDNHLLDIKRSPVKSIRVWKCPKDREMFTGIDWEWFVGSDSLGWYRYAVQAKKLYNYKKERDRYDALNHPVEAKDRNGAVIRKLQINVLEEYARGANAIPLYCLYNHVIRGDFGQFWHCCCEDIEPTQLGCTVTPSHVVREALRRRGCRTFDYIHSKECTLPWRCLTLCPKIVDPKHRPLISWNLIPRQEIGYYKEVPRSVRDLFNPPSEDTPAKQDRAHWTYDLLPEAIGDLQIIPNRILVVELDDYESAQIQD